MPLLNVGKVQGYKIVKYSNFTPDEASIIDNLCDGRIIVELSPISSTDSDPYDGESKNIRRLQLNQILSIHLPQFQQLYINFDDYTYGSMIGCNILPGPRVGETG